ncbi:hypothetical protein D9M69_677990 [compost metagenome]
MRQAGAGLPGNGRHVGLKGGVVHRVHPHSHTRFGRRTEREPSDQRRVIRFAAHGGTVFAIERDVKHAGAELGSEIGLQLQALLHPRLHPAVVVTDWQRERTGLGPNKDVARMGFH